MKERPILFSGPMVRAILDGTKTQTRRIVKPQPHFERRFAGDGLVLHKKKHDQTTSIYSPLIADHCPYGQPGDRLWVRETWQKAGGDTGYWYAATDSEADDGASPVSRWKPSIHMPRWASRINLLITGVRVERLQDIWNNDTACIAEGIEEMPSEKAGPEWRWWRNYTPGNGWTGDGGKPDRLGHPGNSFATLWKSINGADSWDPNPWVWVVEFKVVPK